MEIKDFSFKEIPFKNISFFMNINHIEKEINSLNFEFNNENEITKNFDQMYRKFEKNDEIYKNEDRISKSEYNQRFIKNSKGSSYGKTSPSISNYKFNESTNYLFQYEKNYSTKSYIKSPFYESKHFSTPFLNPFSKNCIQFTKKVNHLAPRTNFQTESNKKRNSFFNASLSKQNQIFKIKMKDHLSPKKID